VTTPATHTYSSALTASGSFPAGTFSYDVATDKVSWSDEVFRIYGFAAGEVVPTADLLLSHTHAEDRADIAAVLDLAKRTGAPFAAYHRIINTKGKLRRILAVGEGQRDGDGSVVRLRGTVADLTSTMAAELGPETAAAVARSAENRAVIEQAKGALMMQFSIDEQAAFAMLSQLSQNLNTPVAAICRELLDTIGDPQSGAEGIRRLFMHCENPPAVTDSGRGPRDEAPAAG
jgi:PAS fold/ANTAR domain